MFRVTGLQEQAPTQNIEAVQSDLANRIALIEQQLSDLDTDRGRFAQSLDRERAAAEAELRRLVLLRDSINTVTGAFPGVSDWVSWLVNLSNIQFDAPENFDDALQFLNGAGDQAFIDLRQQVRTFINDNNGQVPDVSFETTSRQLRSQLKRIARDSQDQAIVQQANSLVGRLDEFLQPERIVAILEAVGLLNDLGVENPGTLSLENIIQRLRDVPEVFQDQGQNLIERINREQIEIDREVGVYGLTLAGQVYEFISALRSLRRNGLLTADIETRLINDQLTEEQVLSLRNNLINTVNTFDTPVGALSRDTLYKGLSSLAALDAADPQNIVLDGPADLAEARESIATALENAKVLLAVWEIAIDSAPRIVPSAGNVSDWVASRGTGAKPAQVSRVSQLNKRIDEVRASIQVLNQGFPPVDTELEEMLESARTGLVRQLDANAKQLQDVRKQYRVVRVFETTQGDQVQIPFHIAGGTGPYNIGLSVMPFNAKAASVTRRLLFEASDYVTDNGRDAILNGTLRFSQQNFADLNQIERENPDAAAAVKQQTPEFNRLRVRQPNGTFVDVPVGASTRVAEPGNYMIVMDRLQDFQTGTFALTFTDSAQGAQRAKDTQYFKVLVNQRRACARTGQTYARLLNAFGDARWTTKPTDAELDKMFEDRVKSVRAPSRPHMENYSQEIKDTKIKMRNLKAELGQFHIQDALERNDVNDPSFYQGRSIEKELDLLKMHLKRLGYTPKARPVITEAEPTVYRPKPIKSVWVGRCSDDQLPTPPMVDRPRRRASESVTSDFAYPVYVRDGDVVYSNQELNYMQAAQFVGFGGKSDEFDWARSAPRGPADAQTTIAANGRRYRADELPIDLQDPQYRKYVERSLLEADLTLAPRELFIAPTIGKRIGGFVSDSDEEPESVQQPIRVSGRIAGFQSDSEESEEIEPVQQTKRVSLEEEALPSRIQARPQIESEDDEYYTYSDDDQEPLVVAAAKDKEEVEDQPEQYVSPFDAKFGSSSGSDDDDELSERVLEAADATKSLRSRWKQVTDMELPSLNVRRASVQDVRDFVAQLSAHSAKARKTSMELARDVQSTLTDVSALSEELS